MQEQQFIRLVRSYAMLSKATGKSYADQVDHLHWLWQQDEGIYLSGKGKSNEHIAKVSAREYPDHLRLMPAARPKK